MYQIFCICRQIAKLIPNKLNNTKINSFLTFVVIIESFTLLIIMSIIVEIMRESATCTRAIKKKYPGLPKYDCPNLEVLKIIAFGPVYDKSTCTIAPYKYPSEENLIIAKELMNMFEANSNLSVKINKTLDWIYTINDARKLEENVEDLNNSYALLNGEEHSPAFIFSYLKNHNADLRNYIILDENTFRFSCWRKELDSTDKWSPITKRVYYDVDIIPCNKSTFFKALEDCDSYIKNYHI